MKEWGQRGAKQRTWHGVGAQYTLLSSFLLSLSPLSFGPHRRSPSMRTSQWHRSPTMKPQPSSGSLSHALDSFDGWSSLPPGNVLSCLGSKPRSPTPLTASSLPSLPLPMFDMSGFLRFHPKPLYFSLYILSTITSTTMWVPDGGLLPRFLWDASDSCLNATSALRMSVEPECGDCNCICLLWCPQPLKQSLVHSGHLMNIIKCMKGGVPG